MNKLHLVLIGITALFIGAVVLQPVATEANERIMASPTPPKTVRPKQSRAGIPKAKIKTGQPNNFEWEGETTEVRTRNPNVNRSVNPSVPPPTKPRRKRGN